MKTNRRHFIASAGLASAGLICGCARKVALKTLDDLKVSYAREATTQEKYTKYGLKALEETFPKIATMFKAIAKAEGIHALIQQKTIQKLKGKYIDNPVGQYEVKSTLGNLQNGLETENYEIETMYPNFMEQAKAEGLADAAEVFRMAYQVEIQHQGYYNLAITAFGTGEQNLPAKWYVCPNCGGTYAEDDVRKTCYFDNTPKEKFFEFL